jgi:hypothetical protein
MKLKFKLSFVVLVINFMINFIFPLGDDCKIERVARKIKQAHHKTQIPLGGKKTGRWVAHSFIASVTMISFLGGL